MNKSHQLGFIIRSCRESRGYSQDYMADMLDIAQSAYACLESGKTSMSIDRLVTITEILELDIHHVIDKGVVVNSLSHNRNTHALAEPDVLYPETKKVYDILIQELRDEIDFLRSIVKKDLITDK